jgi:hypothetical protein
VFVSVFSEVCSLSVLLLVFFWADKEKGIGSIRQNKRRLLRVR